MAVNFAGGDLVVQAKKLITTSADLADKTLITFAGAAPGNAAVAFGVIEKDTPSGYDAVVKYGSSIVEVLATGTVTAGGEVEALQATVVADINGTSTNTTSAGVQDLAVAGTGYPIGIAITGSDAGGTVLVMLYTHQNKAV